MTRYEYCKNFVANLAAVEPNVDDAEYGESLAYILPDVNELSTEEAAAIVTQLNAISLARKQRKEAANGNGE